VTATFFHFHSRLIFVGKAKSLPLESGYVRSSAWVGFSLSYTSWSRVEVTGIDKHSSLHQHGIKYGRKFFIVQTPNSES